LPEKSTGTRLDRPRGSPTEHISKAMTKGVGWKEREKLGVTKG